MRNDNERTAHSPEVARAARPKVRPEDRPEGERRRAATPLWDVDRASQYLNVSPSAIYKMTGQSAAVRIPHIRIGGRLRFRKDDLDHWLASLTTSQPRALERIRRKALKVTHGPNT